ncbi:MAG: carboxypeptidase-like regulatory domain-containing protein [Bacteroidales bacterium]|nr:carboxypeptidase-like regulatory domain-containing protein [Bacteroidales bacterium]
MKRFALLIVLFLLLIPAFGQEISGVVMDAATGETLIGAAVYVEEEPKSRTTTGLDESFRLTTSVSSPTLVFSYLGYDTQTVKPAGAPLTVKLRESAAEQPEDIVSAKVGDVKLIIANDLCRNGYHEQKPIAELMGKVSDAIGPKAILAIGDTHHYLGVGSVDGPPLDNELRTHLLPPRTSGRVVSPSRQPRVSRQHAGRHRLLRVSRRWQMPGRYYTSIFKDGGVKIKVVFIDTTPLIDSYHKKAESYPDIQGQDADAQIKWLEGELSRDDKADWTIVVGKVIHQVKRAK